MGMDAGNGSHLSGNGHADPQAPIPPSTPSAGGNGHPPEPLVVVARDEKGRILPGRSLNPRGKPKGIPNRNLEAHKVVSSREISWCWKLAKAQAKKGDTHLLRYLLDKVLLEQTPAAAGIVINASASASAQASAHTETHNHVEKLLAEPAGREGLAQFAERLAACGLLTGEPRHVRQ